MMRVGEAEPTARESAAPVADLERAAEGGRDGAGFPAYAQDIALNPNHTSVAA
jgi:hypothetical protein